MTPDELHRRGKTELLHGRYDQAASYLQQAAEAGVASAQDDLGFLHKVGRGVPHDPQLAATWYGRAADQGLASAQHNLGILHGEGHLGGSPAERAERAAEQFQRAAAQGFADSQLELGRYHLKGLAGLDVDVTEALRLFQSAADQGQPDAVGFVGILRRFGVLDALPPLPEPVACRQAAEAGDPEAIRLWAAYLFVGVGGPADVDAAAAWYREAAEGGDAPAQRVMGLLAFDGLGGVPKDVDAANAWWQRAADQGDGLGTYFYAESVLEGDGVPRDPARALELFAKAAREGCVDGMVKVADHNLVADSDPQDAKEAARWYQEAARAGHVESQFRLGVLYVGRTGVPKDPKKAVYWLRQAAERRFAAAQARLASCYFQGEGVQENSAEAARWARAAAEQGDAAGQYLLGLLTLRGQGVREDRAFAAHLWREAAEQGHEGAAQELAKLEGGRSPAEEEGGPPSGPPAGPEARAAVSPPPDARPPSESRSPPAAGPPAADPRGAEGEPRTRGGHDREEVERLIRRTQWSGASCLGALGLFGYGFFYSPAPEGRAALVLGVVLIVAGFILIPKGADEDEQSKAMHELVSDEAGERLGGTIVKLIGLALVWLLLAWGVRAAKPLLTEGAHLGGLFSPGSQESHPAVAEHDARLENLRASKDAEGLKRVERERAIVLKGLAAEDPEVRPLAGEAFGRTSTWASRVGDVATLSASIEEQIALDRAARGNR